MLEPDANALRLMSTQRQTIMNNDEPLAYFITWTVYGTFLQGDERGWRKRRKGHQTPQPKLAQWNRERLTHEIRLLDKAQQGAVESEIEQLAMFRGWKVWAKNARTNHVHVVVTASGYSGKKVRDQFKANCTRVLRESWRQFIDRPAWTVGGDWQCVNDEDELEQVVVYVAEAQDRKHVDEPSAGGR